MKIYLKNINHYFLTVDTNGERKKHMVDHFKEYNLTEVNPVAGLERNKSGASGFAKMLDLGLKNQDSSKPFTPFVMYEDDCSKYREYPEFINVPDDADVLYIGLSKYSMDKKEWHGGSYYTNINQDLIRIYNMLATHGIMVCSASGALAIQKAMFEGYYKNVAWDVHLSQIQAYYNVYALKHPLVFQDSTYGGAEQATRFSLDTSIDSPLPKSYLNTSNVSILTCCIPSKK